MSNFHQLPLNHPTYFRMDIFSVHAVAGVVGILMTGLFAQSSVAANDGFSEIDGGWLDHHYVQLAKQLAWVAVCFAWTFGVTYAIMFVINFIPGCSFRSTEEAEIVGMDEVELGEYVADYAYHERDLEGNYEPMNGLPIRAPTPNRGPMNGKTSNGYGPSPDALTTVTDVERTHTRDQQRTETRRRSQSRRRASTRGSGEEHEMADIDFAALRRAESKIAAQQEEIARRGEAPKDR